MAEEEPVDVDKIFDSAAGFVNQYKSRFNREAWLILYGRYKQATEGPCNIPKPGFFNFRAKSKWEAWNSQREDSQTAAKMRYISCLCNMAPNWLQMVEEAKEKACRGGSSTSEGDR